MIYHLRKTIRDTLKTFLIGNTTAGQNVFYDNPDVIKPTQLPCLFISTSSENIEYTTFGFPATQTRSLTLEIIVYVSTNKDIQDKSDQLCGEVETVLSQNVETVKLNGIAMSCLLQSTEFDYSNDYDLNASATRLTYLITYQTQQNSPVAS